MDLDHIIEGNLERKLVKIDRICTLLRLYMTDANEKLTIERMKKLTTYQRNLITLRR